MYIKEMQVKDIKSLHNQKEVAKIRDKGLVLLLHLPSNEYYLFNTNVEVKFGYHRISSYKGVSFNKAVMNIDLSSWPESKKTCKAAGEYIYFDKKILSEQDSIYLESIKNTIIFNSDKIKRHRTILNTVKNGK